MRRTTAVSTFTATIPAYARTSLGSSSAMSYGNGHAQEGQLVPNSLTRYTPFGDYRTGSQSDITDRGFTGHKENRDIGLTYMNARYYLPYINRFLSADTIVPNPTNPQNFNRYSYTNNNPIKYIDPTGHYVAEANNANGCHITNACMPQDGSVVKDPIPKTPSILDIIADNQGEIYDSERVAPLFYEQDSYTFVAMPLGSKQSTRQDKTAMWIGNRLAQLGIMLDFLEVILATEGASPGPAGLDATATYFSGLFTGDNYLFSISESPAGLPPMASINQDTLVNVGEVAAPHAIAAGLVGLGLATPVPGDELVAGGMMATGLTDVITSGASGFYDLARYNGSIQNHLTVGLTTNGIYAIYWP